MQPAGSHPAPLDLQPRVVPMAARVPHALTANVRGSLDAVGHGEKQNFHMSMETDSELTFTSAEFEFEAFR